jgi:uncharacterized protein (DUF1684 family)
MDEQTYRADVQRWRDSMEASLLADDGWLALAGLFWLNEGANSVGADQDSNVALPKGSAPARVAVLQRKGQQVTLLPEPDAGLMVNGEPAVERELRPDMSGSPDLVTLGSLTFFLITRGERIGVRLRDTNSPDRQSFEGRIWYPVMPEYQVMARFLADATPQTILVPNILGDMEEQQSPGVAEFSLNGETLRLRPTTSKGGRLFFILRDSTSGSETYGMGRFLYTDAPKDGEVVLDFNRLYSPPCAFTPFATCPLPPRENYLTVPIAAGERFAGH